MSYVCRVSGRITIDVRMNNQIVLGAPFRCVCPQLFALNCSALLEMFCPPSTNTNCKLFFSVHRSAFSAAGEATSACRRAEEEEEAAGK